MTETELWKKMYLACHKVAHLTRIENAVSFGTPDVDCSYKGMDVWIELKILRGYYVSFKPSQVAWIVKRIQMGGRNIFILVADNYHGWLFHGSELLRPGILESKAGLPAIHINRVKTLFTVEHLSESCDWVNLLEFIFKYTSEKI